MLADDRLVASTVIHRAQISLFASALHEIFTDFFFLYRQAVMIIKRVKQYMYDLFIPLINTCLFSRTRPGKFLDFPQETTQTRRCRNLHWLLYAPLWPIYLLRSIGRSIGQPKKSPGPSHKMAPIRAFIWSLLDRRWTRLSLENAPTVRSSPIAMLPPFVCHSTTATTLPHKRA